MGLKLLKYQNVQIESLCSKDYPYRLWSHFVCERLKTVMALWWILITMIYKKTFSPNILKSTVYNLILLKLTKSSILLFHDLLTDFLTKFILYNFKRTYILPPELYSGIYWFWSCPLTSYNYETLDIHTACCQDWTISLHCNRPWPRNIATVVKFATNIHLFCLQNFTLTPADPDLDLL